ncbi:MAG: hypothetical protein ABIN24_03425 [Dyadobacter sp.]
MKNQTSIKKIVLPENKVDKGISDISNDPFLLNKKQNSIDFLKQYPIPENML